MIKRAVAAGLAALSLAGTLVVADSAFVPVPYPQGYRDWTHVKSMVIEEGHPLYASFGGIHHLYANELAMQGYRTKQFPDGSIIVFDLLEATSGGQAVVEGERKIVGVMHKDDARWPDTHGWGFEGFKANSKTERAVGDQAATACMACHLSQQTNDYVFSEFRR